MMKSNRNISCSLLKCLVLKCLVLLKCLVFVCLVYELSVFVSCGICSPQETAPDIPEPLKPWIGWVLHNKTQSLDCIPHFNDPDVLQCGWATAIDFEINTLNVNTLNVNTPNVNTPNVNTPNNIKTSSNFTQGKFTQEWHIYHETYVPLPGNSSQCPLNVMVNGVPAVVIFQTVSGGVFDRTVSQGVFNRTVSGGVFDRTVSQGVSAVNIDQSVPVINLQPGHHTITGTFFWHKQPEYIQIPPESALVTLHINNSANVEFPNVDDLGRLWLKTQHVEQKEENRLKVENFRLIDDSIPPRVTLYTTLDVAGAAREVKLGPLYSSKEFIPLSLETTLPSKLESDGTIQIQAKPGRYNITLILRHLGQLSSIAFEPPEDGYSPKQEIWSVVRHSDLRIVEISGVPAIDPKMTSLPEEWRSYPAYAIQPKNTIVFKEIKRGDPIPPPDQLTLDRTLWLSFDGIGYTVQDRIRGKKNSGWRIEMEPLMRSGKVTVDGVEQLITRLDKVDITPLNKVDNGKAGVELRHGTLDLSAESRIYGSIYNIPATGWTHSFQRVTGRLNLPPGWKLIDARGIDNISGTWVQRWTLLDIFIVLIFTIATAKLFSKGLAILGFITLVLLYHEPGAPKYIWLFLLAGFAFNITQKVNELPKSEKFKKMVKLYQFSITIILLFISVLYSIESLRIGIYPQLEKQWISMNDNNAFNNYQAGGSFNAQAPMQDARAPMENEQVLMQNRQIPIQPSMEEAPIGESPIEEAYKMGDKYKRRAEGKLMDIAKKSTGTLAYLKAEKQALESQMRVMQYDPKSLTQTGPGLPLWQPFKTINFSWSGPVEPGQMISFTLLGPSINLILAFLRVALIILLTIGIFNASGYLTIGIFRSSRHQVKKFVILISICLLTVFAPCLIFASEIPSAEMLAELQNRLLEKDNCFPACADISKMELSIKSAQIENQSEQIENESKQIQNEFDQIENQSKQLQKIEQLEIILYVDVAINTAIPLPGNTRHWLPGEVLINGVNADALFRKDETIWMMVPAGKQRIVVTGKIGNQNIFQLPLPLKPHLGIIDNVKGWEVQGVQPDGTLDDQLQFKKIEKTTEYKKGNQTNLPPFVIIERTLLLGLDWKVATTVQRLTPTGSAIVLNLPLIKGESVITDGVRVKNGVVEVTLNSNQTNLIFESFLEYSETVELFHSLGNLDSPTGNLDTSTGNLDTSTGNLDTTTDNENREWTEVWKLDVSPIFHVETEGIPVIMHQTNDRWYPTWHPWSGERVKLKISKPKGIEGQTLTIEKSTLELNPGQRSTHATLTLLIKSSQGGQHTIKIPERAELQEVTINGEAQLIRQEGSNVVLPISPGSQNVKIIWKGDKGFIPFYRTPIVDLGAPSVNSALDLHISSDRWPLFVGGEQLTGPAILFWSVLIVVFIVSAGLTMTGWTPLKFYQWFLLGIGMSMSNGVASIFVASWLIVLSKRKKKGEQIFKTAENLFKPSETLKPEENLKQAETLKPSETLKPEENLKQAETLKPSETLKPEENYKVKKFTLLKFNLMQLGIVGLTFFALFSLLFAISQGLMGHPSMNITGNGSTERLLRWYHDISNATLPVAWLFSLPMMAYRLSMLAWSLWLAFWLLTILKWGWEQFITPIIWASSTIFKESVQEQGVFRENLSNDGESTEEGVEGKEAVSKDGVSNDGTLKNRVLKEKKRGLMRIKNFFKSDS